MMTGIYKDIAPTALEQAAWLACNKLRCAQPATATGFPLD